MIIPDVNLLVYAHNSLIPEHESARAWLESSIRGPETIGLAWVVLLGFVRLLSSPQIVITDLSFEFGASTSKRRVTR